MSATHRIESTPEYRAEFERLLDVTAKAEAAFKKASDELKRAEAALLRHIESRHFLPAPD